jgi:hypothetical protein
MEIEYLPGIKAGQKIDLEKFKKDRAKGPNFEVQAVQLKNKLESLAQAVNQEFPEFLESDGRIALAGQEAVSDQILVDKQTEAFGKNVEKNPASLTEMALTVTLHRFLKNDFIVARASRYDDYNNGIDQVIIDKRNGDVICGFDEVLGYQGDDGGEKKTKKMARIMEKGGAEIKYGATMENGRLVRSAIKNVPAFYLALSKEELKELLESLAKGDTDISEIEVHIFNKLLNSLEEQASQGKANWALKAKTQLALDKLRNSFGKKIAA